MSTEDPHINVKMKESTPLLFSTSDSIRSGDTFQSFSTDSISSSNESSGDSNNDEGAYETNDADQDMGTEDSHGPVIMEMGLTRNLSLLPEDIVDAALNTNGYHLVTSHQPEPYGRFLSDDDDEESYDLEMPDTASHPPDIVATQRQQVEETTSQTPFIAYVLLGAAIVAMSAVGPLLQLQSDVTPTMKISWRLAGTAILLVPFAAIDLWKEGPDLLLRLTTSQWITFTLSTVSYAFFCVAFCLALDYTSVGNATILSNSMVLLLLVGKLFTGGPVTLLEAVGAMVAFGGAVLCSKDSASTSSSHDDMSHNDSSCLSTIYGDFLALSSAIGRLGYIVFARRCRKHMPICFFTFLTMAVGCMMIIVFQVTVLQEVVTFDMDANHGLWGFIVWDRLDRLILEIIIVIVCNVVGTMGWCAALPYFSSLVLCSVVLLEPVIAEFLAFFFGTGVLPGCLGWFGNLAVAAGTFVVLCQSETTSKTADSKETAETLK